MSEGEFPPFVPAKPKGSVAAEIAASKPIVQKPQFQTAGVADPGPHPLEVVKPRRKRRTREEMAAANGGEPRRDNAFAIYCQIVDLLEFVDKKTRMLMFKMLIENHT
jgi:hypothetical protein